MGDEVSLPTLCKGEYKKKGRTKGQRNYGQLCRRVGGKFRLRPKSKKKTDGMWNDRVEGS